MKKSGVKNYTAFAKKILKIVNKKPISFEVFSDEFEGMYNQAKKIASWGNNVYVKLPITNTKGEPIYNLISKRFFYTGNICDNNCSYGYNELWPSLQLMPMA